MTPTDTIGTPSAVVLHSGHSTGVLAPLDGTQTYLGADPGHGTDGVSRLTVELERARSGA